MPLPDDLLPHARKCRACGKALLFAKTAAGKTVPLDVVAPAYTIEVSGDGTGTVMATRVQAYVSHFSTCPAANDFSRASKAKEQPKSEGDK